MPYTGPLGTGMHRGNAPRRWSRWSLLHFVLLSVERDPSRIGGEPFAEQGRWQRFDPWGERPANAFCRRANIAHDPHEQAAALVDRFLRSQRRDGLGVDFVFFGGNRDGWPVFQSPIGCICLAGVIFGRYPFGRSRDDLYELLTCPTRRQPIAHVAFGGQAWQMDNLDGRRLSLNA